MHKTWKNVADQYEIFASLLGNNIADVNIYCTSPINQIIICIVKTEKKTLHEFQIKNINPKSNCCIINKKKKVISTNIYL